MAKDTQSKKRKASVPEVEAEKVKKVKNTVPAATEVPAKKRKATDDAAPAPAKKSKTPKPIVPKANGALKPTEKAAATSAKKALASKAKNLKPEIEADEELDSGLEDADNDLEEDDESEVDDQTLALLKGFESDGDDDDEANTEGLPEGQPVPARKELTKKEEKKLKKIAEAGAPDKPGVIYLGRIPHGFYENEMKAYFKQFGNILKLRMSRNKKTGASKHYAWIQFESATVADIVARTMDNYLMFGHLLKVKFIPDEQVNPDWFKGANKRFKKVPWNKMEGRKLGQGASEEVWNERKEREEKRRESKAAKMKEIGYEFVAPKVKSATGVAKPKAPEEIANGESAVEALKAAPAAEETSKPKKKGKKGKASESVGSEPVIIAPSKAEKKDVEESIDALITKAAEEPKKASKKVKAVKATVVVEEVAVVEESPKPKAKKEKKTKKVEEVVEEVVPEVAAAAPVPEKKLKTKKSKTSLVETAVAPLEEEPEEKTKKGKKSKKEKVAA